jgi:branched-subunit amino acid aminotransferase/4-amino-4-deoxychorismate lyase
MAESLNRAFLYGESVFTTLKMENGELKHWDLHFDRLKKGIEFMFGPFLDQDNWVPVFKNRLESTIQHEEGEKVVRWTVYRHQARGLRKLNLISTSDLKIHASVRTFEPDRTVGRSVRLRSCPAPMKPHWWPEYLKAGSYLDTILAQRFYLKENDDDVLFLSPNDTLLESSVANIFVVRHNKLYTAPTGPNVLDGVMRKRVIEVAAEIFEDVVEVATDMEQALKADAIFATNSVRGIFMVQALDDHEFNPDPELVKKINSLRAHV